MMKPCEERVPSVFNLRRPKCIRPEGHQGFHRSVAGFRWGSHDMSKVPAITDRLDPPPKPEVVLKPIPEKTQAELEDLWRAVPVEYRGMFKFREKSRRL